MSAQTQAADNGSGWRWALDAFSGLMVLRYAVLRAFTAGAAVVTGLVQTFVFARVLTPRDFAIFILIGSFGMALWLFDLGAAKILFVRQRQRHLAETRDDAVPVQSNAVVLLYAAVVLIATGLCFAIAASRPTVTTAQASQFAAFFLFAALNLVWFPLRNVSNAVDEFVTFEVLETVRRIGHLLLMLLLLVGLPLTGFLALANMLWLVVIAACLARLVGNGALAWRFRGSAAALAAFWRANRAELLRSGNYAVGELAVYNFPYFVVPAAFGLGAPMIVLDTVFKIFRGATLIYAAGLDPLVPTQTRAFAAGDIRTLKRATWTAALLCAVPTLALCALLVFAGDRLFAWLLGGAATMPHQATLILVVLLVANLVQNVASNLLLHTGFFRPIAAVATFLVAAMAAMTVVVIACGAGVIGFIAGYAAVYTVGAGIYVAYVQRKIFARA